MKLSTLFLAAALALAARPAHAEFTSLSDASIGFAEGNQAGNVVLTLSGTGEAVAQGLTLDVDAGRWSGFGRIDYDGNGISVHESNAAFSVRIEAFDPPAGCTSPITSPAFAAHIEVRDSGGDLILVAGNPVRSDVTPCPTWRLTAVVGHKLPSTLALLKPRYRDGVSAAHGPQPSSLGHVKGDYIRTVSGRYIKASI